MIISVRGLTGSIRGDGPLRDFSAEFAPGVTAVIGQEGAGKAALFAMLAGQLRPEGGVLLVGMPGSMVPLRDYKGSLGYLPAWTELPRGRTVEAVLSREAATRRLGKQYARERMETVLRLLGLAVARDTKIADCTDDVLRRTAIAATLLPDPEILLLEEPFIGLLPQERMRLSAILAGLPRGKVVLLGVCEPAQAETGVDRVLFIVGGRCAFSAPKDLLVAGLRGKVWRVTVPPDDAWQIRTTHVVSGQQRVFREQQLRVVAEGPPAATLAVPEEPMVGDAYAWCLARGPEKLTQWVQQDS